MSWVAIGVGVGSLVAGGISSAQASGAQSKSSRHALARSQKWQKEMYQTQLKEWKKYAFPNAGAIKAEQQGAMNTLGQAYQGLGNKVFSQSATRGFGPGSGLTMQSLGNTQGSYLQALSQMMTNLAKFKNTPQWAAPTIGSAPNVTGTPAGGTANYMADVFSTLGGYALAGGFGGFGGGSTDYSTPFGAQFGVANPYAYNAPYFEGQGGGYGF